MIPLPDNKTCPTCQGQDFSLATDFTRYTHIDVVDGNLCAIADFDEDDGGVRFFCTQCGEYFEVPEELLP